MNKVTLLTLYARDARGTLRLTESDGLLAEPLMPARTRFDSLVAVWADGLETLERTGAREFRSKRGGLPRAVFLLDRGAIAARAGDRSVQLPRPQQSASAPTVDRQVSAQPSELSPALQEPPPPVRQTKPPQAAEARTASAVDRQAPAPTAERQSPAPPSTTSFDPNSFVQQPPTRPSAPVRQTFAMPSEPSPALQPSAPSRTAPAADKQPSAPVPASDAARAIAEQARTLFRTDAAPMRENPFPRDFPNAVWTRVELPAGGWYWRGVGGGLDVRAVRSRPSPRPPRALSHFTVPLRAEDGSFWWASVKKAPKQ